MRGSNYTLATAVTFEYAKTRCMYTTFASLVCKCAFSILLCGAPLCAVDRPAQTKEVYLHFKQTTLSLTLTKRRFNYIFKSQIHLLLLNSEWNQDSYISFRDKKAFKFFLFAISTLLNRAVSTYRYVASFVNHHLLFYLAWFWYYVE